MNTTNAKNLKAAAEAGDINLLYSVIQDDPSVLERIDLIPFVETPLHIAAYKGHLQFANEVMRLKPSFALKLNQQGFSPIHLAMQNNQKRMVLRFVDINKDLVRIKGREGLTPLHLASQAGEIDLLAMFLFACPESIEDATMRYETALHIAVKNEQYDALQVLVSWLNTNTRRGAEKLEYEMLNWEDEEGNTILHVSAQNNQSQAVQVLLKTGINLNATNLENATALDIARSTEIKSILSGAGAILGSEVSQVTDTPTVPTLADELRSKITITMGKVSIMIRRSRSDLSDEERNALLVVATLIITTTYQSALTPPGGVYQISAEEKINSTTTANPRIVGKSILPVEDFYFLSYLNMLSLLVSIAAILILIPRGGVVGSLVTMPLGWFVLYYIVSVAKVSPTGFDYLIYIFITISLFAVLFWTSITVCSRLQRYVKNREIKTRATRGNI